MLIALETGKIVSEGEAEVNEFINVCDFAAGLSRTACGLMIPSERKDHQIIEQWNPLGLIGVITAFNFPCAVLGRNFGLAFVCGNSTVWKPSATVTLVAVAMTKIIHDVFSKNNIPKGCFVLTQIPSRELGDVFLSDDRLKLISFTGSTLIGKRVSELTSKRLGRTILELGGNSALIICEDADVENAIKAVVAASVTTTGQRCTAVRRVVVHESLYEYVKERLIKIYSHIKIGDPFNPSTNVGPLHTKNAVFEFEKAIETIKQQGGKILVGGRKHEALTEGFYVYPTIVEIDKDAPIA